MDLYEETVKGTYPFECDKCSLKFSNYTVLDMHKNQTGRFLCDNCCCTFNNKLAYSKHQQIHIKKRDIKLDAASEVDINQLKNNEHIVSSDAKTDDPKVRRHRFKNENQCNICLKLFQNKHKLEIHMFIHTGEFPFSCDKCGLKFNQPGHIIQHKRRVGRKHQCPKCCASYKLYTQLKKHQMKFHMDKTRSFNNRLTFSKPRQSQLDEKNISIDDASKVNVNLSKNNEHVVNSDAKADDPKVKLRSFEAENRCKKCKKRFQNKYALKMHMFLHTGELPFSCDKCGLKFNQPGHVLQHKRRVGRKHQCPKCCASFKLYGQLNNHQRKFHMDKSRSSPSKSITNQVVQKARMFKARKYKAKEKYQGLQCNICLKTLSKKVNLSRHIRTVHFTCDICSKKFKCAENVFKHIALVHRRKKDGRTSNKKKTISKSRNSKEIKYGPNTKWPHDIATRNINVNNKTRKNEKCINVNIKKDKKKITDIKCNKCLKTFQDLWQLKRHIKFVHSKGRKFKCDICLKPFKYFSSVQRHAKNIHNWNITAKLLNDVKDSEKCQKKRRLQRLSHAKNIKSKYENIVRNTRKADMVSFKPTVDLKSQKSRTHNQNPFTGYRIPKDCSRYGLRYSTVTSYEEPPQDVLRYYSDDENQINIESGENCKRGVCSETSKGKESTQADDNMERKTYKRKCTAFSKHVGQVETNKFNISDGTINVPKKSKENKCYICSKTFSRKDAVTRHIKKQHTGNVTDELHFEKGKTFKCNICPKMFKSSYHVKLHLQNVHSVKKNKNVAFEILNDCNLDQHKAASKEVFKCHLCSRIFTCRSSVTCHVMKVHGDQLVNAPQDSNKSPPVVCLDKNTNNTANVSSETKTKELDMDDQDKYKRNIAMKTYPFENHKTEIHQRKSKVSSNNILPGKNKHFQCGICLRSFTQLEKVIRHKYTIHNKKQCKKGSKIHLTHSNKLINKVRKLGNSCRNLFPYKGTQVSDTLRTASAAIDSSVTYSQSDKSSTSSFVSSSSTTGDCLQNVICLSSDSVISSSMFTTNTCFSSLSISTSNNKVSPVTPSETSTAALLVSTSRGPKDIPYIAHTDTYRTISVDSISSTVVPLVASTFVSAVSSVSSRDALVGNSAGPYTVSPLNPVSNIDDPLVTSTGAYTIHPVNSISIVDKPLITSTGLYTIHGVSPISSVENPLVTSAIPNIVSSVCSIISTDVPSLVFSGTASSTIASNLQLDHGKISTPALYPDKGTRNNANFRNKREQLEIYAVDEHKCNICMKTFSCTSNLRMHKINMHQQNLDDSSTGHLIPGGNSKNVHCDMCLKSFAPAESVTLYQNTVHNIKIYKCKTCSGLSVNNCPQLTQLLSSQSFENNSRDLILGNNTLTNTCFSSSFISRSSAEVARTNTTAVVFSNNQSTHPSLSDTYTTSTTLNSMNIPLLTSTNTCITSSVNPINGTGLTLVNSTGSYSVSPVSSISITENPLVTFSGTCTTSTVSCISSTDTPLVTVSDTYTVGSISNTDVPIVISSGSCTDLSVHSTIGCNVTNNSLFSSDPNTAPVGSYSSTNVPLVTCPCTCAASSEITSSISQLNYTEISATVCPDKNTKINANVVNKTNTNAADKHICDICMKTFSTPYSAKRHKILVHLQKRDRANAGNLAPREKNKKFLCDICFKEFTRAENVTFHKYTIHNKEAYKCKIDSETDKHYSLSSNTQQFENFYPYTNENQQVYYDNPCPTSNTIDSSVAYNQCSASSLIPWSGTTEVDKLNSSSICSCSDSVISISSGTDVLSEVDTFTSTSSLISRSNTEVSPFIAPDVSKISLTGTYTASSVVSISSTGVPLITSTGPYTSSSVSSLSSLNIALVTLNSPCTVASYHSNGSMNVPLITSQRQCIASSYSFMNSTNASSDPITSTGTVGLYIFSRNSELSPNCIDTNGNISQIYTSSKSSKMRKDICSTCSPLTCASKTSVLSSVNLPNNNSSMKQSSYTSTNTECLSKYLSVAPMNESVICSSAGFNSKNGSSLYTNRPLHAIIHSANRRRPSPCILTGSFSSISSPFVSTSVPRKYTGNLNKSASSNFTPIDSNDSLTATIIPSVNAAFENNTGSPVDLPPTDRFSKTSSSPVDLVSCIPSTRSSENSLISSKCRFWRPV